MSIVFIGLGVPGDPLGIAGLALMAISLSGLWRMHRQAYRADQVLRDALRRGLGDDFKSRIPAHRQSALREQVPVSEWLRPFSMKRPGVEQLADIAYGDAGERNLLDIYRPDQPREGGFPVLLQVHGGGWFSGHKQQQAAPLLNHLPQRGWLCVSINYRLSPTDKFPAHIVDVKKAIHWIRQHIAEYGGNPDFIAITGGSAGGHLATLAALSANDPIYQPGFEEADTHLDAANPLYGVYDFLDRENRNLNQALRGFLADKVMPDGPNECRELWDQASPVVRIHEQAPPFFVIHGDTDVMTSWDLAREFSNALAKESGQVVSHAELPGCQHGFDGMHSIRCDYMVNHITNFLEWAHASADS